jgi:hypothetical protein
VDVVVAEGVAEGVIVGVGVIVAVGVIVGVIVGVLVGRGVTVGGTGRGVTVAGPTRGVRVGKGVGDGNGVSVMVGVPVTVGVLTGVNVGVMVIVGRGVRVGRGVGVLVGSLVGVCRGGSAISAGSVGPAVAFSPPSIRMGARVPMAVGPVRLRIAVSSGARLHACNRTMHTSISGRTIARHARGWTRRGKEVGYGAIYKTITYVS